MIANLDVLNHNAVGVADGSKDEASCIFFQIADLKSYLKKWTEYIIFMLHRMSFVAQFPL